LSANYLARHLGFSTKLSVAIVIAEYDAREWLCFKQIKIRHKRNKLEGMVLNGKQK
jgi:hypothetical protein